MGSQKKRKQRARKLRAKRESEPEFPIGELGWSFRRSKQFPSERTIILNFEDQDLELNYNQQAVVDKWSQLRDDFHEAETRLDQVHIVSDYLADVLNSWGSLNSDTAQLAARSFIQ